MTDEEKISKIKELLDTGLYKGQSSNEIVVLLNQKDPALSSQVRVSVDSSAVRAIFLGNVAPKTQSSSWARIKRCSEGRLSGLPDEIRETIEDLCTTVYDACALQEVLEPARFDAIDHALEVMEQTGFISTDTKNTLEGLSWLTVEKSWADVNVEGRFISTEDIDQARG